MKLTILGASGGVGRILVRRAVDKGHTVVAVARASSTVDDVAGATLLRGSLTDEAFLREAIRGSAVVLSCLGLRIAGLAPWHKPEEPDFLRQSTDAIVRAMKSEGVARVVAVSSGGVGDSRDIIPGFFKAFIALSAMKRVFEELDAMEQRYLSSGLDVCIVRPSGLTDEPATGRVVVTKRFAGRATISRADVAEYMLAQAERESFSERTPVITVTGAG